MIALQCVFSVKRFNFITQAANTFNDRSLTANPL